MKYCLSKNELISLLHEEMAGGFKDGGSLEYLVDNARSWSSELIGINYFLAQILERQKKQGQDCLATISAFYRLDVTMFFSIQEMTDVFLDFMLRNISDRSLLLEDRLIQIQQNLADYDYSTTVRF